MTLERFRKPISESKGRSIISPHLEPENPDSP